MPRKSIASLSIVTPITRVPRVQAPEGCAPAVRAEFVAIVDSLAADHFRKSDAPLLLRMAETIVAVREARDTDEFIKLTRIQIALARALRLCPSSRGHHRTTARQKTPTGARPPWEDVE